MFVGTKKLKIIWKIYGDLIGVILFILWITLGFLFTGIVFEKMRKYYGYNSTVLQLRTDTIFELYMTYWAEGFFVNIFIIIAIIIIMFIKFIYGDILDRRDKYYAELAKANI